MSAIEHTPKQLNEAQRVARVFRSQGRAVSLADHLPQEYRRRVAALCDAQGQVSPTAAREFPKILRALADENKAAVKGLED